MRFSLIDRVIDLKPGESISTIKNSSVAEEYLADHFPGFAVMPGVLMLEAMTQSAAWLIRVTDNYQHSLVTLAEVRNIKYIHFVVPGEKLEIEVSILSREPGLTKVKAEGRVGDRVALSGRLTMRHENIVDTHPSMGWKDAWVVDELKKLYEILTQ